MNTNANKVRLVGNLGFNPEVRETNGRKVVRFSMATRDSYRNAAGEQVIDTQWHTVVAWGETAEMAERLLRKGTPLMIEGRLVHRSYDTKDGERFVSEVVMSSFQLLPKEDNPVTLTDLGQDTYAVMFGRKCVGTAYRLEDGCYYYDQETTYGVMSAWSMRAIADKLDELNREWEEQIASDPAIGKGSIK